MLNRIKNFASLYRELGPRWSAFRVAYAFRLRTGLIRLQMPMGEWEDYKNRVSNKSAGRVGLSGAKPVSRPSELPQTISWNPQIAVEEADRILNGKIKYFAHEWVKTGFPPNWHTDPVSNLQSPQKLHWSQISDEDVAARRSWFSLASPARADVPKQSPRNGGLLRREEQEPSSQRHVDIKFIWEPNRFAFVYTLVRAYAATQDEKYPEAFWILIEDWAKHNPPNTGPNWMDGQEIALRLMAWTFGYHAFLNSPATTQLRISQFTVFVATQAERIHKNIDYAISTKSNHTISEAFGLWMIGLLFPELKHAEKYFTLGRKLLEQSAAEQIFPDGAYSMYSLNYHRFILQIYLYAIQLSENYQLPFTNSLRTSVTKSIEYLSHLVNPQTGEMPNYGSNDGALVLPLNNCHFTDYRPLLQLGWYITKKEFLFEHGAWDEDIFWICGESFTAKHAKGAKEENKNLSDLRALSGESFPRGGIHLLHSTNSHVLIHCTDFTSRPSHADQLHMDLWIHGQEIAIDAGTYLYSGQSIWRNGLAHTNVHNTVTVDNKDQMTMVSRFTWTNWSKGKVLKHEKNLWQGEHDGYKPVSHKRTVMVLSDDRWLVIDKLSAKDSHHYALHWLLNDFPFEQKENSILLSLSETKFKIQVGMTERNGKFSLLRADPNSTRGWRSRYYGHKEPAISVMLEATQPQVTFWSFFGFEDDVVEVVGNELRINSKPISLVE